MTDAPSPLPDEMFLAFPDDDTPEARATLSFSRSPTVLLTFAANRFTRSAARVYQQEYGIGAMDWRMLVMLTRVPGCSVALASKTIGIDKAAVSRSLTRLEQAGLAVAETPLPDPRRRDWTLTDKGRALHERILHTALERQRKLLEGFSEAEVEMFNDFLRRFLGNLETL
ncbi:MarR family winged helix-turn-helix transcriptional regulator [Thalassobius vesicularis]|uniref:MarR family winged helix-turn-helix transcriptional regulator n=1 Tax=Thalassobius vesicularis TaxID=1294297 RepID=UPI001FEB43B7|nr:MarR family transcriptional regulator [Thalassobius vesicularis]